MIIDFHTHYYPDKVVKKALAATGSAFPPVVDGTRSGLLHSMEQAGIDFSVGLPLVNTPANSRGVNAWAAKECHWRIHCLGSVHPAEDHPLDTLQFIADHGMRGIKMHPEYQQFDFADESLFPIWERCIELNLFLLTHAGFDIAYPPPFRTNPEKILNFHRRFPELKLIAAHLGSMRMWDEVEAYLIGENIFFDLAFITGQEISPARLASIIRRHGADKILFGTDSPWREQKTAVQFIESLDLSREEKEMIFHRNAESLLGFTPGNGAELAGVLGT